MSRPTRYRAAVSASLSSVLTPVWAFALAAMLSPWAWGQTYLDEVDPAPDQMDWVAVILAMLLLVLVAFVSFKSSKRGHQD